MNIAILVMVWGLPFIGLGVGISAGLLLREFVRSTPSIETGAHLELFKKKVARDMYASLLVIFLIILSVGGLSFGFYHQLVSWKAIGLWLGVFGPLYVVGGAMITAVEERARDISVSPELKRQYDDVVRVWRSKPFPDW